MKQFFLARVLFGVLCLVSVVGTSACGGGGPSGDASVTIEGERVEFSSVERAEKHLSQLDIDLVSRDGRKLSLIVDFTMGSRNIACSRVGYITASVQYTDEEGHAYAHYTEGGCDIQLVNGVDDGDDMVILYFGGTLVFEGDTVDLVGGTATIYGLD